MVNRKGLGQANILRTNNNTSTGYGIVYADEVSGHRTVANLTALYALHDWQLSASGDNTGSDAIGQLWYVVNADDNGNGCYYQLKDWSKRNETAGWSIADYTTKAELQDKIDNIATADEEDITTEGDTPQTQVLKLKDRTYDSLNASGKGYKILRKNTQPVNIATVDIVVIGTPTVSGNITITINGTQIAISLDSATDINASTTATTIANAIKKAMLGYNVTVTSNKVSLEKSTSEKVSVSTLDTGETGAIISIMDGTKKIVKNILSPSIIKDSNTIYEVRYDFDLDGAIINMPYNSFLLFKGGTIINGTILNLKQEICPEDFGAKGDGIADDYAAVLMAINSSNTINFKGSYNFNGRTLLLEKKQNFLIFNKSDAEYNIINGTIKLGGSLKFITIDGIRINNSNKLEYGIFAEGNINILRLKNLYVTKCSTAGISLVNCWDCYISKCSCTSNNIGLYMKNCFSSNVIKSNAYYNNIGVKVDGDASTNYNMTIQENLYTGFEGLSIVACTLNLYLEQNGYRGTNNKEKSQIYLGSLPSEENTKGCLCRLYCVGGKGSEMESPYNLYLNGASSNLIVGSYYRSTVTDIYITSSYNTNNIVLSNKGASVVNGNPSNKINNEVPNKDSDDLSIGEYIFTSKPYFKSANGLIDCFGNSSTFKAVDNYANRPNGVSGSVFLNKDKSYTPSICINNSDYINVQPIINSTDTKNVFIGTLCYDLKKKRIAAFNGDIFVATNGFNINFNINGATEDRPTLNQEHSGFQYYDTTLKKYIVWNGTEWTNMDGSSL